ncbi:hypothetical protein STEG23_010207 [Scotinomys teguina]
MRGGRKQRPPEREEAKCDHCTREGKFIRVHNQCIGEHAIPTALPSWCEEFSSLWTHELRWLIAVKIQDVNPLARPGSTLVEFTVTMDIRSWVII